MTTEILEVEFPVMRYDISLPLLEGRVPIDGVKLWRAFLDGIKPVVPHLFLSSHPSVQHFLGLFCPVHTFAPFFFLDCWLGSRHQKMLALTACCCKHHSKVVPEPFTFRKDWYITINISRCREDNFGSSIIARTTPPSSSPLGSRMPA